VAAAIAVIQARVNAINAAQAAHVAWLEAVAQQNQQLASTHDYVESLVTVIRGMFAGSASALADFGQAPKKTAPLTAEEQLAANQKRAATRLARHTMGTKQKAAIKGTVPATPATATTPATPATTATPAATTGATGTTGATPAHN